MALARRKLQALRLESRTESLTVRVRGGCMEPALASGALVEVQQARLYWPGDVVVFATTTGELTVHRVIGWGPTSWSRPWRRWAVWTQADGAVAPDAPVASERLLGRVPARPGLRMRVASALRLARHLALRFTARARGTATKAA